MFGKRLQILAKKYVTNKVGTLPFKMGRDFHRNMKAQDKSILSMRPDFLDGLKRLEREDKER